MDVIDISMPLKEARTRRVFDISGDLYLQAESTAFVVSEPIFKSHGIVAESSVHRGREIFGDELGRSLQTALTFLTIAAEQLEFYLELLYTIVLEPGLLPALEDRETFASLAAILKVATVFFDMRSRNYALARLDVLPAFSPARRLTIAVDYFIPEWFDKAVMDLMWLPLDDFDEYDVLSSMTRKIVRLKTDLIRYRLAFITKTPISATCRACVRGTCPAKWELAFREFCGPILIKQCDSPYLMVHELRRVLEPRSTVCEMCFEANMAHLDELDAGMRRQMEFWVNIWRATFGFWDTGAAVKAIARRRDPAELDERGVAVETDLEFLAKCVGLGVDTIRRAK